MLLNTLYKRTKTSAIQYWKVNVNNLGSSVEIRKESGQLGTLSPIVHKELITQGKNIGRSNATTAFEQAQLQAQSDWTKKKDEGYKTLGDLGITEHYGYVSCNGQDLPLAEMLDIQLPKFNSDASGNVKPMLAPNKAWKIGTKMKWPQIIQDKFDGLRGMLKLTPDETVVLSRSGKVYGNMTHLVEALDELFPKEQRTKAILLDGELYLHGLSLQEINKAVRGENEYTVQVQFWVYDLPLMDAPQKKRTEMVTELLRTPFNHDLFVPVYSKWVQNEQEAQVFHDKAVADGYEGAMLKDPEGTYQPGQRSSFWRKVKEFDDTEFEIIGHKLGQRGSQDLMFTCKCAAGTFDAPMNGTIEAKAKLYEVIDSFIGKKLTVKHFGYTMYGIPDLPKGKAIREVGS